jgi:hypothetical protein
MLVTVVLAGFAVRLVVVFFTYRDLPDADKHFERFGWEMGWIARSLAEGHGFSSPYYPLSGPTALEPPLYPALLAVIFRLFGIYSLRSAFVALTLNGLFSALTCMPVYFSARYALGQKHARFAAWAWAFYPFAIYFSAARPWEYALTGLLFTSAFCIAQRIHRSRNPLAWLGWGALFALTAYSNATVLSTLPFLLAVALWQVRKQGGRWLLYGCLTTIGTLAVLAPWTIRNYQVLGILCPMRDNLWMEIYVDNFGNAPFENASPPSAEARPYPANDPAELRTYLSMGEVAYMAHDRSLSLADLHQHPHYSFLIKKTLRRILYYWTGFWSFSSAELQAQPTEPALVFYIGSVTLLMLRGVGRMARRNPIALGPYLVLLAVFPLTYYFTNPLMDYRQAIEPAVVVLAVTGAFPFRHRPAARRSMPPGDTHNLHAPQSSILNVLISEVSDALPRRSPTRHSHCR